MPLPYVSFLVLLPLALLLTLPAREVLDRQDGVLFAAAAVLGGAIAVVWPVGRYRVEDPAGSMLAIFAGDHPLDAVTSRFISPPAMELFAAGLGGVGFEDPRTLMLSAVVAGVVWTWTMAVLARRWTGRLVLGWLVLAWLAIDPERLSWSHASYHVMVPTALLGLGMLASGSAPLLTGRSRVTLMAAAGLWVALAASVRIDALAWLPAVAAWGYGRDRRTWILVPSVACGGLATLMVGSRSAHGLEEAGWTVGAAARALASASAGGELLAPWSGLVGLAVVLVLVVRRDRGAPPKEPGARWLIAALAVGALAEATFFDFGARHLLPARGLVAILICGGLASLPDRVGAALAAVLGLALAVASADRSGAYYADPPREDTPPAALAEGPLLAEADLQALAADGCRFVSHNEDYFAGWERERRVDLLEMLDPAAARAAWDDGTGCVVWLRDQDDLRWQESVRLSRSHRMAALWSWEPVGHARLEANGAWFQVLRLRGDGAPQTRSPVLRALRGLLPRAFGGAD